MGYDEALRAVKNLPREYRGHVVYQLLTDGDISYAELSKAYVESLEESKRKDRNVKAELAACLLSETVDQRGPKSKSVKAALERSVHRTIAILDLVGCFQLDHMKEKYKYDEHVGKSQGIFWK